MDLDIKIVDPPFRYDWRIDGKSWEYRVSGALNFRRKGYLEPGKAEELSELAEELEGGETLTTAEKILSKLTGGKVVTDDGEYIWVGEPPEEVEELIGKVKDYSSPESKTQTMRQAENAISDYLL